MFIRETETDPAGCLHAVLGLQFLQLSWKHFGPKYRYRFICVWLPRPGAYYAPVESNSTATDNERLAKRYTKQIKAKYGDTTTSYQANAVTERIRDPPLQCHCKNDPSMQKYFPSSVSVWLPVSMPFYTRSDCLWRHISASEPLITLKNDVSLIHGNIGRLWTEKSHISGMKSACHLTSGSDFTVRWRCR